MAMRLWHSNHSYATEKTVRRRSSSKIDAFSLAELLVALIVGTLIFVAANDLMLGHMRSSIRQESILRLQENWNRVRFILDQDLNEGSGACFTSASSLSIFSIQGDSTKTITYTLNSSNQLIRTGPPINADGSLAAGSTYQSDVIADNVTVFSEVTAAASCSESTAPNQISYNMTLVEANNNINVSYSNSSMAASGRAKIDPIN